jgi:phosphatidate cytidylyltransferase
MTGEEPDIDQPRGMVGGRNLPVAIGVGLALAAVFLGSLFWDARAFVAVVAVLTVVAYLEARRVLGSIGLGLHLPVAAGATIVMLLGARLGEVRGQAIGVATLFAGAVLWPLADRRRHDVVRTIGTTVTFGLWVGFLASYAVLLVGLESGPVLVLAVIGAAAISDIGAYAVGVSIGRNQLAPSVSPNKSWEGVVGGTIVILIVALSIVPAIDPFDTSRAVGLALVLALVAPIGDLVESALKRDLGVKDMGTLLPGHGGVLDRFDAIYFTVPLTYALLPLLLV